MIETRRVLALILMVAGCRGGGAAAEDSAYAEVQRRGEAVMGVDQYTSQHVFESLADGGRVVLERDDSADAADIRTIRAHMRDVEKAFAEGNFSAPFAVHAQEVPGTRVMAARRSAITYASNELPRGAELRMLTRDTAAIRAVHEFLAFQRSDHRATGHGAH